VSVDFFFLELTLLHILLACEWRLEFGWSFFFFAWLVGWLEKTVMVEILYYFSLYSFVFSYERLTSGLYYLFLSERVGGVEVCWCVVALIQGTVCM
jgi:hypothetical protein